jgi:hypothetical protein
MISQFLIYGLVDAGTGQLRYIGRSSSGLRRPARHFYPSELKKDNSHKGRWLRASGKPKVVVIQELDGPTLLNVAEVFWIAYFREMGCPLTNLTDGGEGSVGLKRGPNARLAAFNRARSGIPLTPEHRSRVSSTLKAIGHMPPAKNRAPGPFSKERLARMLIHRQVRPVLGPDGVIYPSTAAAARAFGLWQQNVKAVLKGKLKTTGGHVFRYANSDGFGSK